MLGQMEKTDNRDEVPARPGRRRPSLGVVIALVAIVLAGSGAALVAFSSSGAAQAASQPGVSLAALNTALGRPSYQRCQLRPRCRRRIAVLRMLREGLHGQLTYETPYGPRTVAFERGTTGSVQGGAVTVTALDHTTWTWHLVSDTVIRQDGRRVSRSSLASGQRVLVVGPVRGSTNDARLIVIGAAAPAR
jgi:hypothetical protein